MSGGLYCGGLAGTKFRNRLYVSCVDWVPYGPDYVVPKQPFTAFRREPYAVRADWEVQIILCYETCRKLGGQFFEAESLAGLGPLCWNAPMECIKEVRDRAGWVIYRRPPACTEPIAEGPIFAEIPTLL